MGSSNPIIIKEFIQGAHRPRTFVVRALLPAVVAVMAGLQLATVLAAMGQDWRALARVGRPLFMTVGWGQFIILPLVAYSYARTAITDEWDRKTMEVLCATPASAGAIVYGKFAAVLGKVLMLALALLPIQGIGLHIARVPWQMTLASAGAIAAFTIFCAALSIAHASLRGVRKKKRGSNLDALLFYICLVAPLGIFVWKRNPVLVAALPYWAFSHISSWTAPAGMKPGVFTLLMVGVNLGLAALALGLAPRFFQRAFDRHIGSAGARPRRRWFRSVRPPLGPTENPFAWQERGTNSRALRWPFWAIGALTVLVFIVVRFFEPQAIAFDEPMLYIILAIEGIAVVILMSLKFATEVFAREKAAGTAPTLILTGQKPAVFYRAKLWTIYRNVAPSLAAILVLGGVCLHLGANPSAIWATNFVCIVILGPLLAGILGLTFSAAARSPSAAIGAFFLSLLHGYWIGILVSLAVNLSEEFAPLLVLIVGVALIVVLSVRRPRWTAGRLGLMLALTATVLIDAVVLLYYIVDKAVGLASSSWEMAIESAVLFCAVALMTVWCALGLRIFDRCMLGETEKSGRG